jgi:hypothetical protein
MSSYVVYPPNINKTVQRSQNKQKIYNVILILNLNGAQINEIVTNL